MKKTTGKIALIVALLMLVTVCLTACGGEKKEEAAPAAEAYTGDKFVYEGSEMVIKAADLPEGSAIAYDTFVEGFKALAVDKTITTSSTYADVAKAFGGEGIKMAGMAYEGYAYYSWYSDKDAGSDGKVGVLITFKDDGKALTYYAWTSSTITPDDVNK